jgi:hypothetical protein
VDGKWLLRAATISAAAVALVGPGPAAAAACPPEQTVAALDQYCESLPMPGGVAGPTDEGEGEVPRGRLRSVLPPKQVKQLRRAGPAARALLELPAVAPLARAFMTPAERRRADLGAREVIASGTLERRRGDVGSVASGLASAAPDVVGGTFRWGLVICSLALSGLAWLRFRTRLKL